ncbi:MAG: M20/M25/M40 family metallo-hydrolase [Gammaproteobacteria bacterium]|nr:M20/M25/M40 family metallo-hydrolase [Gammaproteobacteria bacterium]
MSPDSATKYSYDKEIAKLAALPKVEKALKFTLSQSKINEADLIELTEIPAPPFGEDKRANRFADMLRNAGLSDVSIDDVGNVIGRRPGTKDGRVVAISAHLDTVFPIETDVKVRREGRRLYAPGIGDNTAGVVMILSVLRALEHADITTRDTVLFIGNVGEEGLGDLRGIKHLFRKQAEKIDSIIVVDGGKLSRMVVGGVGSHRYRVTFKGPGGHSWGAYGLVNPHHALGRAIAIFDKNAMSVANGEIKTSHNIGRIGGGTSVNSIPFESWFEVDMRSSSQAQIDKMDAVLQKSVHQAVKEENADKKRGEDLRVDIKMVGKRPAAKGDPEWPLVNRVAASLRYLGVEPELTQSSTDASIPMSLGIPALTISRGGISSGAHSLEEFWQDDEAYRAIQMGILSLLAEGGIAK